MTLALYGLMRTSKYEEASKKAKVAEREGVKDMKEERGKRGERGGEDS